MRSIVLGLMVLLCWPSLSYARLKPLVLQGQQEASLRASLRPKKLALVIGIQHFQRDSGWQSLKYPKKDARRFAKMLKDASFDHVLLRTEAKETTRSALIDALKRLGKMAKGAGDTVLVYISSHGTVAVPTDGKTPERFIITSDTNAKVHKTALSVKTMLSLLKRYLSKRILLMLAVCYNGQNQSKSQLPRGMKGNALNTQPLRTPSTAIQILSAASRGQAAFEHKQLHGDVYTHFYLKCFYKYWKKKPITAIDAHICAVKPTKEFVKNNLGALQVPALASELDANRDIFLFQKKQHKKGYLRTTWAKGKSLIFRVFRWGRKGSQRAVRFQANANEDIALSPGRYRVAILNQQGQTLHTQQLDIQAGSTAHLEEPFVISAFGSFMSAGKMNNASSIGATLSLQKQHFGLQLNLQQTQLPLANDSYNLLFYGELRAVIGYPWHIVPQFDIFAGAYGGFGLLTQQVTRTPRTGPVGSYGVMAQAAWWFLPTMGVTLQADTGFSVLQLGETLEHLFEYSIKLGVQWRI